MPIYLEPEQVFDMSEETVSELNSIIKATDGRVLSFFDKDKKFLGVCICDNDKADKLKRKHLKERVGVAVGIEIIRPTMIAKN